MAKLHYEQTLMTANGGLITLTTHRVLKSSQKVKEEMMLSDYRSFNITRKSVKSYEILAAIFLFGALASGIMIGTNYNFNTGPVYILRGVFIVSSIAAITLFTLYVRKANRRVRLIGAVNSMEFYIKHTKMEVVNKFLISLIIESEQRKRELAEVERAPKPGTYIDVAGGVV
jgi:cytochrome b subunit of formate dehydrogenase